MTIWNRARIFGIFMQLLHNPTRTDLIFKGVEIVSLDPDQELVKALENEVLSNGDFKKMHETKYVPEAPSLEMLRNCPEDSFGRAVYNHMNENKLDFSLWPKYDSDRPIQYLSTRIYQDHDLWHALLGYGVAVEDELAIQAFSLAQFKSPIALLLVAGGLIHLLVKSPKRAFEAFKKLNETYTLGRRTHFLLSIRLHDLFLRPLTDVRQICGVV